MNPRLIAMAISTLMLIATNYAAAGSYRMSQGKGFAVCEAFKRTLSKLDDLRRPLSCPNRLLAKTSGISRPDWREVEFNFDLYLKLMALRSRFADYDALTAEKPFDPTKHPRFVKELRRNAESNKLRMFVAELDTNSDGRLETVLRLEREEPDGCHWNGLFFVNPQLTDLDETPYWPTIPEWTMNTYGYSIDGATEIILYAGKVLFFMTGSPLTEFFFLRDHLGGRRPICAFEFTSFTQGAKK
jgi:hypothetical protein